MVPLTTSRRGLSIHIEVGANADNVLDDTSYIQCELIRSVNQNRLRHRLGAIDSEVSNQVTTVVKTLLNH